MSSLSRRSRARWPLEPLVAVFAVLALALGGAGAKVKVCYTTAGNPSTFPVFSGGYRVYTFGGDRVYLTDRSTFSGAFPGNSYDSFEASDWRFVCVELDTDKDDLESKTLSTSGDAAPCMTRRASPAPAPLHGRVFRRYVDTPTDQPALSVLYDAGATDAGDFILEEWCGRSANMGVFLSQPGCYMSDGLGCVPSFVGATEVMNIRSTYTMAASGGSPLVPDYSPDEDVMTLKLCCSNTGLTIACSAAGGNRVGSACGTDNNGVCTFAGCKCDPDNKRYTRAHCTRGCGDGLVEQAEKEECDRGLLDEYATHCSDSCLYSFGERELFTFIAYEFPTTVRVSFRTDLLPAAGFVTPSELFVHVQDGSTGSALDGYPKAVSVSGTSAQTVTLTGNFRAGGDYSLRAIVRSPLTPDNVDWSSGAVTGRLHFTTGCGCGSGTTGTPDTFAVSQSGESIFFSWVDRASCETRFNVYRKRTSDAGEPTFLTAFVFKNPVACDASFAPTSNPDLVPELELGVEYTYYIEAQAQAPTREYTSPRASVRHVVQFVSTLVIQVTTTTGGPVAGAQVWLENVATGTALGSTVTVDKSGSVKVLFNTPEATTTTLDVRVHISSTAGAIAHVFACAGVPCTSTVTTVVHLSTTSVVFVDTSLVDITGTLTFAGTSTYTAGAGACALVDPAVKVCAYQTSDNRELYCSSLSTESATRGQYSLAVPVYTAAFVQPSWQAGARAHVFSPVMRTVTVVETAVSGMNFEDVTTSTVTATVVASACALYMGPSRLTMRIPSCGAYERTLDAGTSFKGQLDTVFALPAVPIEITFRDIHPSFPALSFPPTSISPLNVPVYLTGVDQALVALALDTVVSGAARWEYHVPTTLAINSLGVLYECNPATPIRVVKQDANLLGRILLVEDYGDAGKCVNVTGGSVRLYDEVSDERSSCTTREPPGFCELPLTIDNKGNTLAEFSLAVGGPNVVAPHLNYLRFEYQLNKALALSTLSVAFLTEGDRGRGEPFTLRLPPTVPSLVLHDPPGDGSCASFSSENSNGYEVTISHSTSAGQKVDIEVTAGFEKEVDQCAGPVAVLTCTETATAETNVEATAGLEWKVTPSNEHTFGVTETTTSTYTTSCDEGGTPPGMMSDMVLAPITTIKYELTDTVSWLEAQCRGNVSTAIKWLPVSDTSSTVSFQSFQDISEFIVPELERVLLLVPRDDAVRLLLIRAAVTGWNAVLADIEGAYRSSERLFGDLAGDANVGLTNAILDTDEVLFSGGGSVLERSVSTTKTTSVAYSVEMTYTAELVDVLEQEGTWVTVSLGATQTFTTTLEVTVGVSGSSTSERTTSSSFALSDNDVGDFFELSIVKDPNHGTPVFKPISGSSMCPYEGRPYVQRETFDFVARTASLVEDLPADGSAFFSFEVQNLAPYEEELALTLSLDPGSNPDALAVFYQATVLTDRTFSAAYGEPFTVLLEAKRGPLAWLYNELAVTVSSSCDGAIAHTLTLSAHFLQPCSSVSWAGDLALAGSWIVNGAADNVFPDMLRGYAKNPQYSETRWAEHTRTRAVSLEYRPDGALLWRSARDVDSAAIVLTSAEDRFGFAFFEWDLASLPDGVYDLRVVARCEPSPMGGEFDESAAPVLRGLVDRSRPELFGFPEPVDGVFFPGDSVSFTFDAGLRCALPYVFATTVLVDGVDVSTDVPVKCEGDTISLALGRRGAPIETIGGATVAVSLTGVQDVAGNVGNNVAYEFVVFDFAGETADALVNPVVVRVPYDEFVLAAQAYTDAFVGALEAALAARLGDQYDVESQLTGRLGLVGVESTVDGLTKFGIYVSAGVAPTAGALADTLVVLLGELAAAAAELRPPPPTVPEPDVAPAAPVSARARKLLPPASDETARTLRVPSEQSSSPLARRAPRTRARTLASPQRAAANAAGLSIRGSALAVAPADILLALDNNPELAPVAQSLPAIEDSEAAKSQSADVRNKLIAESYMAPVSSRAAAPRVVVRPTVMTLNATLVTVLAIAVVGFVLLAYALVSLVLLYRRIALHGTAGSDARTGLKAAKSSHASDDACKSDTTSSSGSDSE